jgi:hypothetical protein
MASKPNPFAAKKPAMPTMTKVPPKKASPIQPAQMKSATGAKPNPFANATTGKAFKGGGKVKC